MLNAAARFREQFGTAGLSIPRLEELFESPQRPHIPGIHIWATAPNAKTGLKGHHWEGFTRPDEPSNRDRRNSAENQSTPLYAAEVLTGTLAEAFSATDGPSAPPEQYYHFPRAFDPAWLATLPLSIGANRPDHQRITFPTDSGFERFATDKEAAAAHAHKARTRIYEDTARLDNGWQAKLAEYLMELTGYELEFSFFESLEGDSGLGAHTDTWHTAAIQFQDDRAWWLGQDVYDNVPEPTVVLQPGDILMVPADYPHDVRALSGHSVHLAIGTRLDCPIPRD